MLFNTRLSFFILATIFILVIAGCSGGGNPSTPIIPSDDQISSADLSEPIEGLAMGILGAYHIAVDPISLGYEIYPVRDLDAIGDIAILDITSYFLATPCHDCFGIESIGLTSEKYMDITFKMKHPFPVTSSRNDLDVFDVRGIMILDGDSTFGMLPYIDLDGDGFVDEPPTGDFDTLMNADGYTYHFDYIAQDLYGLDIAGNLNPYRMFFNENNPDPDVNGNEIPYHKMAKGSPFDKKHYILKLDTNGEVLDFVFVIECSYGQSSIFGLPPEELGSRQNPLYFNPEFNSKEAYRVDVDTTGNLIEGSTSSSTTVTVSVEDWQNSTVPGWNIENSSSIKYRSDVASVTLAAPDINSSVLTKTSPTTGNGSRFNPYIYEFELTNANGVTFGEYTGLVAVMDQYQTDGRTVQGMTASMKFATFTTYQAVRFTVHEAAANTPPVAVASANPNPAGHNQTVNLIDASSYDSDAGDSISLYEWDFDYDGMTFDIDASSSTSNNASTSYENTTGDDIQVTVCLRVTDQHSDTDLQEVLITVHTETSNNPPVAVASANPNPVNHNQLVNLIDISSHDDDTGDSITLYEWDYDYDGVTFDVDHSSVSANNASTTYQNTTGADIQITAGLRVTDENTATDIAEVVITVRKQVTNNTNPIAIANANPNPVTSGRTVSFLDILSYDEDAGDMITAYKWDTNIYDGINWEYESDLPNQAFHVYINEGLDPIQFTARLRVEDMNGGWDTDDITITVTPNRPPVAVCDAEPNPARGGLEVTLICSDSYDPDPSGEIILFEWDFEYDGVTFEADYTFNDDDDVQHAYENMTGEPIIYTAALQVTDNRLTMDICTVDITVNPNNPPIPVGYVTPDPQYAGYPVTFHAEGSHDDDPGDTVTKIEWDFEDDGIFDWSSTIISATTTHTYTNGTGDPIDVTAVLRAYDEANVYADVDVVFTIDPPLPIPIITHEENRTTNNTGLTYTYKSFSTSAAAINFSTGPWDFTTFGPGATYVETFLSPGAAEVSGFIGTYPDATTVFKTTQGTAVGYGPRFYQDELWGGYQVELGQETSQGDLYSMPFDNWAYIPFPMQQYYSESLYANGSMFEGLIFFTFSFDIQQVGYGLVKTEAGTFNCLLMRTYTIFSATEMDDQEYLTFEWLADDGRKIATMVSETFDNITMIPFGTIKGGRLQY